MTKRIHNDEGLQETTNRSCGINPGVPFGYMHVAADYQTLNMIVSWLSVMVLPLTLVYTLRFGTWNKVVGVLTLLYVSGSTSTIRCMF